MKQGQSLDNIFNQIRSSHLTSEMVNVILNRLNEAEHIIAVSNSEDQNSANMDDEPAHISVSDDSNSNIVEEQSEAQLSEDAEERKVWKPQNDPLCKTVSSSMLEMQRKYEELKEDFGNLQEQYKLVEDQEQLIKNCSGKGLEDLSYVELNKLEKKLKATLERISTEKEKVYLN
eukprot:TRINITY_DN1107_c0_g5_i1.p1 TRINITY_DN1107_c0_g5~~TRINITY_DN1107_c0_g5_i1.p1  ORF type:complete len:174 (+),score=53.15 TRINITY_DN1107_c0_g5_i1:134-655(+)